MPRPEMHQRSKDLSTPLLGGGVSDKSSHQNDDDGAAVTVRTRRPRRDFNLISKGKVGVLALYLIFFFLVYTDTLEDLDLDGTLFDLFDPPGLGWTLVSIFIFLVLLLPKREWNRPLGSCCHPGTNMSSINATIESRSEGEEEDMKQTPAHVLRKVACDTCGSACSRIKVFIVLISISVLWAALFTSVVYGITCILNPSGETSYMLRHGLKQLVPLGD